MSALNAEVPHLAAQVGEQSRVLVHRADILNRMPASVIGSAEGQQFLNVANRNPVFVVGEDQVFRLPEVISKIIFAVVDAVTHTLEVVYRRNQERILFRSLSLKVEALFHDLQVALLHGRAVRKGQVSEPVLHDGDAAAQDGFRLFRIDKLLNRVKTSSNVRLRDSIRFRHFSIESALIRQRTESRITVI